MTTHRRVLILKHVRLYDYGYKRRRDTRGYVDANGEIWWPREDRAVSGRPCAICGRPVWRGWLEAQHRAMVCDAHVVVVASEEMRA